MGTRFTGPEFAVVAVTVTLAVAVLIFAPDLLVAGWDWIVHSAQAIFAN